MSTEHPPLLWTPDPARAATSRLSAFQQFAATHHGAPQTAGLSPQAAYATLHRWSVERLEDFWRAVTEW
ncbi:hypothetical protein, partial [Streptomyces phaeochromogenes]